MNSHHIVRIGNNVYCGGGFTGRVSTDRLVFKYDCKEEEWSKLPICPSLHFGLTQLDEKLVTVGGRDIDELTPVKDVYIFEEDSQTWENFNKPLSIARCSPCVVAYKSVLVVSGGIVTWKFDFEHPGRTDTVEVFQDSQWHASVPLPFELSSMSCAIINGMCYIIGGRKQGVYPIDRFALYQSPASSIQNPVVNAPRHHPSGNIVTVRFSSPHQQSREEISWPLEGRVTVMNPLQLSTNICPPLSHGRQSLMALYQSQNSKLLQ